MNRSGASESRRALRTLTLGFLIAAFGAITFSRYSGGGERVLAASSVSVLLLGTSALSGGFLGFLFGIPRTLRNDGTKGVLREPSQAPSENVSSLEPNLTAKSSTDPGGGYIANTNLEQISDWLTKILVGVGLTQLNSIKVGIRDVVEEIAPAFGSTGYEKPFIALILFFGLILGFLFGYLWTRLYLIGALRDADRIETLEAKAAATERKVDDLKKQSQVDADALSLVDHQLNPRSGIPAPSAGELRDAVVNASRSVRTQIFYRARDLREKTWSDPRSKSTMELTIPVFRALIASDSERQYHMNHGQLGFALMDKNNPDFSEAEGEFTTAIDIRDRIGPEGWGLYELYRAICIIKQDSKFTSSSPSDERTKRRVIADLRKAFQDEEAWESIGHEENLTDWCNVNGISLESLRTKANT